MIMELNKIVNDVKKLRNFSNPSGILTEETLHVFHLMIKIETTNIAVVECIGHLLEMQLSFCDRRSDERIESFLNWLFDVYSKNADAECYALRVMTKIANLYPNYQTMIFNLLFHPQSPICSLIGNDNILKKCDLYILSALECINIGFNDSQNKNTADWDINSCKTLLAFLIRMHYSANFNACKEPQITLHSLMLLKKCISCCQNNIKLYVSELMEISLGFMFFGNSIKKENQSRPYKLQPSFQYFYDTSDELNSVETNSHLKTGGKLGKQKRYRGTKTKGVVNHKPETNKNDKSIEDDVTTYLQNPLKINVKIRITSLSLFGEVIRSTERRCIYSYWQSIYPSEILDNMSGRNDILLVCQTDENARCRCAALHICTELFLNSKSLFSQAEYKDKSTAFVPLAQMLGLTILGSYKALNTIIQKETSSHVLIQTLKCLAALVQITPFSKFQCTSVYDFISEIKKLASHSDITLQVSALTVLEHLLMEPEIGFDVLEYIGISKERLVSYRKYRENLKIFRLEAMGNANEKSYKEKSDFETSWLINKVFHNLGAAYYTDGNGIRKLKASNPLRIKSLQLLTAMSTHFELLLKNDLEKIAIVLEHILNDSQLEVRLCGSKCLETCVYQISLFLQNCDNVNHIDICRRFWSRMLPVIMKKINIERESTGVKLALCDALSNISVIVFENLTQSIRISLLSLLTGVSSNPMEDVIIRATVVRALSVFVNFPSMRVDLVFIENIAESILRLGKDENIVVRIKIVWSMGNVSDALLENNAETVTERISDEILMSLIRYSTEACNDNDKVRCNAVRTVGNLMRLLSQKHFSNDVDRTLISSGINKLIDSIRSSGTSKVKWNSCYAIGNMLQNENIYLCSEMYDDLNWESALYSTLCHVIYSHQNYKVKINATAALTRITKRTYLGDYFIPIWTTIMRAIEQSHALNNFYEYNHRDQFQEQLCLLMSHIINVAALDDVVVLSRVLLEKSEVVKSTWARVMARMIPEKAASLLSCSGHLDTFLKSNPGITVEQTNALKFLKDFITIY